jgi:hypothetical protein
MNHFGARTAWRISQMHHVIPWRVVERLADFDSTTYAKLALAVAPLREYKRCWL